jgi:hypothetical protein
LTLFIYIINIVSFSLYEKLKAISLWVPSARVI